MKKSKRIAALLTAALLAMAPCALAGMTAFADEGDDPVVTEPSGETTPSAYKITVNATAAANSAFSGYQIFKGNYSGGKLNDIEWGSAIPSASVAALLTELQGDDVFKKDGTNLFSSLTSESSAAAFADVMGGITDKSDMANELAKVLGKYATTAVTDTQSADNVIGDVPSGYYLVKETSDPSQTNPISLNLLKVVGADATINTKEDLPTLSKEIDEEGGIAANTASVGDKVPFILKSKVPDMTGYTKYFFVMNDTLSKGLTYDTDSLKIYVNGSQISSDKYEVTTSGTDTTNIKIVFKDFYNNYKSLNDEDDTNDDIVVKYSATVNENADMTQDGNVNTAQLTYSNNPNETAIPDGDEPNDDSPVGKTPVEKTVTYVTQIDLLKTKADGTTPLAGAKFTLEGYKKTVGVSAGKYYVEDATGSYYRLKDGTFTTAAPTAATAYDSLGTKYKLVEDATTITGDAYKITMEADPSGTDGKINFKGLGEGVYTITETEAPDGFNKLQKPITVTITATGVTIEGCDWDKELDDPNGAVVNPTSVEFDDGTKTADSKLPLTVKNTEGSTLPSTGGMGTKLFYLIGSLLAAGSGVVLVTKKRMANTEK